MRKILLVFILLLMILVGVFGYFSYKNETLTLGSKLYVRDAVVNVEIVDDAGRLARGLSGRESLCGDCGMLFVFPNSQKRFFWMKEMKISLDMLFINNGKVVEIYESVPVPVEGQDGREIKVITKDGADMVLEVNSGWVEKNEVKAGDKIELKNQ